MMVAPVFAPDARTREALLRHPGISEVFSRAQNLDLAIVSVGDLSPNSTMSRYGLVERDDVAALLKAGAVGDVLCRFIDPNGRGLDHPLNETVISAEPKSLHGINPGVRRMGESRSRAIGAAHPGAGGFRNGSRRRQHTDDLSARAGATRIKAV
jgi:DNA-binding transcriptional regulator LsrR (DeoR family)